MELAALGSVVWTVAVSAYRCHIPFCVVSFELQLFHIQALPKDNTLVADSILQIAHRTAPTLVVAIDVVLAARLSKWYAGAAGSSDQGGNLYASCRNARATSTVMPDQTNLPSYDLYDPAPPGQHLSKPETLGRPSISPRIACEQISTDRVDMRLA